MTVNKNTCYDSIPLKSETESDVMSIVGQNGRWQLSVFIHIFFTMTLIALQNLSMTFLAPNLDHWCSTIPVVTNFSSQEWMGAARLSHDRQCSWYETVNITSLEEDPSNTSSSRIMRCYSWEHDKIFYSTTLLSKWNLVCERKWLVSLAKSIFMIGILLSFFVFGHLSDRFGRKPIIVSSSILTTVFSTLCAFSPSITLFIIVRFFVGVGLGGYHNASFVLLLEIVVPEMRSMYGMGVQLGWSFGFICLPGLAWLIRDSFWMQIALSAISSIMMIFSWMIPESPRWLLSRGRVEEARKILVQAAKTNKLTDADVDNALNKVMANAELRHEESKKNKTVVDLLKTSGLRRLTAFLFLIWFIISFIYYGLSFNTNELTGDPFVNFALSGAMEFPAYFLSVFIIKSIGRKRPLAASMIAGGIICLVLYLIPIDIPETIVAAAMVGKFFITCSFGILYVFTAELFPTVVRNIGLGSSTVCEGLGSIIAPFIRELGHATHPAIPQFLFGVLSIAGGALVIFLPETNNVIVSDTIEDAAHISE